MYGRRYISKSAFVINFATGLFLAVATATSSAAPGGADPAHTYAPGIPT